MKNPFTLEGKCILVTGASSGIGRGIAVACAKMGAKVVLNGRNVERMNETLSMLDGKGHMVISSDLSKQDGINYLVSRCPDINGLVHSAGVPSIRGVKHIDRSLIEEIININDIAPILLTSALLKQKKLHKKSSIVFVASVSGVFVGNIGEASYSASKGALSGFVKSAAVELAAQGTRVNTICPGVVETRLLNLSNEMFSEDQLKETMLGRYPLKRFGKPEDIAYGAVYLLSDASSWVTGINLLIDGGYCL
jgi:NAD(P)-dependent dehydrogenase (short-subunit alcohol dehydrogenase family)